MAIRDIYIRPREDKSYKQDVIHFDDEYESILTQIKVVLGTTKGEVLGNIDFGINLEDLVFETNINSEEVKARIKEHLAMYVTPSFPTHRIDCEVRFGHHPDGWDYCIVDINIDGQNVLGFEIS